MRAVVERNMSAACACAGPAPSPTGTSRQVCAAWGRLYPCVYRVEGSSRTWRQQLKAASLWAARDFAISHRAAAALWGFARFPEGLVELTMARPARAHGSAVVHRADGPLPHRDLESIEGFRVTSAARTLADLASVEPEETVRASVEEALTRRWTTLEKLEVVLERAQRRRGTVFLRELFSGYRGGDGLSESELESRVLELFEAEGLPRPQRQRAVVAGGRLRRLDFLVPGTPVVVEADGHASHSSPAAFEKDRERNNALVARGFVVLHWTWAALHDRPEELVVQLRRMLGQRSRPLGG